MTDHCLQRMKLRISYWLGWTCGIVVGWVLPLICLAAMTSLVMWGVLSFLEADGALAVAKSGLAVGLGLWGMAVIARG